MYEDDDNSEQGEARILSPEEVDEAKRSGHLFVQIMKKVRAGMSSRDRAFYQMGLRAAHMEEGLATGEVERAEEHFKKLLEIASHILTARMERALAEGDEDEAVYHAMRLEALEQRRRLL